jgi:hypothetical protein
MVARNTTGLERTTTLSFAWFDVSIFVDWLLFTELKAVQSDFV